VPRQLAEGAVRPEKKLRAIGHVLMPERSWTHGFDHGASHLPVELVIDP
jgi:hypothetical protein